MPIVVRARRLEGCEKDSGCVELSMVGLAELYAFQVLREESYLKGTEDFM